MVTEVATACVLTHRASITAVCTRSLARFTFVYICETIKKIFNPVVSFDKKYNNPKMSVFVAKNKWTLKPEECWVWLDQGFLTFSWSRTTFIILVKLGPLLL